MKKLTLLAFILLLMPATLLAHQESIFIAQDSSELTVDSIRFETVSYSIDTATSTATVRLTLTCLSKQSRELKVNVYGTQLVDDQRGAYFFSTMTLGRVLIQFEDRQNYLHYLLQPHTPVDLTIIAQDISPEATAIQVVKIVFEDSKEQGEFLEAYLIDPTTK